MKQFENKKTDLLKRDEENQRDENVCFAELAVITLNVPPANGWTTDDMRKRLPLADKLEKLKPKAKLLLENSEVDLLAECLKMKWKMPHKGIIEYEDYITDLQKQKDTAVKAK